MHEQAVAGLDASLVQAGRDPQDPLTELAIGPDPPLPLERLPDQERMIAARLGPKVEKPIHVAPGERIDDLTGCVLLQCRHAILGWC